MNETTAPATTIPADTQVILHVARKGQKPYRAMSIGEANGAWLDVPNGTPEADVLAFVASKLAKVNRQVAQPSAERPDMTVARQLATTQFTKPGFTRWSVRLARTGGIVL